MKKILVISLVVLLGAGGFLYQEWLYDTYLDIRYGRTVVYFAVDYEGNWLPVESKSESDFYRISRVDKNNQPMGKVKAYYSDSDALYWVGHVKSVDPFVPDGVCTTFFQDGSTKEVVRFIQGQLDGEYWEFYNSGLIKFAGRYSQGLADSTCISYYPNAQIMDSVIFKKGKLNGFFIEYDSLGDIKFSGHYIDDIPDSTHVTYYPGNRTAQIVNYEKGQPDGYYAEFDTAGNNIITGNYKNGLSHGVFFVENDVDIPNELFLNDTLYLVDVNLSKVWATASEGEIRSLSRMVGQGDSLFDMGEYKEALNIYESVLQLFPDLHMVISKRGEAYFELATTEDEAYYRFAVKDLYKTVGIEDNRNYWRYYIIAMSEYYLGDFDMSLNWFELANLTIPDDENGQVLKGICYNQMAKIYIEKHNFQQALNMYNNAIEITPDRSDYYLGRAWTHFKLGNRMSSLEDCVEAISIGAETMEEQAESYALMALIKFEDGEFGEAEYWVSKSLEVNSSEPYSVHLFSALYPGISSEGVNSGSFGQMLAGISIGLIFWEAATVYRLLMAGRFLGAASEIAGSVVVGAGLDELADVEESNKSLTLRNSRRSQRRSLSDLSNASVIINSSTQSIEQRVNQFQSKYAGARNYQGITKYHNKYYVLAGGHEVKNLNYYQKYHIDKNPRDAWEQFLNHHNYVYDQVFLERIDYVGDKWQFISSAHSSHDHGCQIIIDDKFPKDKILKAWSDKMKIMDIDHGEGSWVVTLRNDCVSHSWFPYIKQQFVQITYEFPEELIKTYWKRGYFISKLKFVGDKWLLLMEEYKWNTNVKEQRVLVENFFPTDRAYEHEQIGYDLQSISHGRGLWAVVVTKKE